MSTRLFLAAAIAALAPACTTSSSTGVVVDDPVGDTIDEGHANGSNVAAQAYGELSIDDYDTMIGKTAGILAAINDGEINQAAFAVQILNDDDVFNFANDMIIHHEDANAQLDNTVRYYGVPYLSSQAQAQLTAEAQAGLSELRATPPEDVDFVYTEMQVRMHAEAQVILDQLGDLAGPGPMSDYIINARAMVDDHLARATDLLDSYY